MALADLDDVYFADMPWAQRLERWLRGHLNDDQFLSANSEAVGVIARRRDLGLRMGVNIPAHQLLLFLRDGRYKNGYEIEPEAGERGGPSTTRQQVDGALFPAPKTPKEHYFGAAVLGGSGVRYYGDYCIVLKEADSVIPNDTQVMDRNSYDAMFPPLGDHAPIQEIVERLKGEWRDDLLPMAKLKILPGLAESRRLTTAGVASEILLHDESFVEVHKRGSFGPGDVHEIRESAADAAVESDLARRSSGGQTLSPEESLWLTRRREVDQALAKLGMRTRIIVSSGRTR